jgi:hypothetical protein
MEYKNNITKEDIIVVLFNGMDMKKFQDSNVDKKIEDLRSLINIWENKKHILEKK